MIRIRRMGLFLKEIMANWYRNKKAKELLEIANQKVENLIEKN